MDHLGTRVSAGCWSRRRFLQAASLASFAAALPQLARAAGGVAAGAALSVGYVLGSDEVGDPTRPAWLTAWRAASQSRAAGESSLAASSPALQVVPAAELLGDPRLAVVPVRVAVLGLYPELDDVPGATFDLVLTVHFDTDDPFHPELPFHAWGWRDDPAPSSGSPTRFTVPVERELGLRLSLDVRQVEESVGLSRMLPGGGGVRRQGGAGTAGTAATAARTAWSLATTLSLGLESATPKLQRGVYLLGLQAGMWEWPGELPAGAFPGELPPSLVVAIDAIDAAEEAGEVF